MGLWEANKLRSTGSREEAGHDAQDPSTLVISILHSAVLQRIGREYVQSTYHVEYTSTYDMYSVQGLTYRLPFTYIFLYPYPLFNPHTYGYGRN